MLCVQMLMLTIFAFGEYINYTSVISLDINMKIVSITMLALCHCWTVEMQIMSNCQSKLLMTMIAITERHPGHYQTCRTHQTLVMLLLPQKN